MKKGIFCAMLAAGILASCEQKTEVTDRPTQDTAVLQDQGRVEGSSDANTSTPDWDMVDRTSTPEVRYDEVTDKDLRLRGNDRYTVYSVGGSVLFSTGSADIRANAVEKLRQVSNSITQRYPQGNIRIYGYTDAAGDAAKNRELSQKRADAVKQWLVTNGNIAAERLSVHPMGETNAAGATGGEPTTTTQKKVEGVNTTNQQDRRVDIVAMK